MTTLDESRSPATAIDFIGRGFAFPMRVDHTGGIALVGGVDDIDKSIHLILSTAPGERVMRPRFGCAIWDLVFAPLITSMLGEMELAVREALLQWEPRIELDDVEAQPDPDVAARVLIRIRYRVKATNDARNLVYPFYVIPEEEGA